MKIMARSTITDFTLVDGTKVGLTLNFSRLLEVRSKRKDTYERYNKVIMEGLTDIFDQITVVYTAYLCGLEDLETAIPRKEFIELIPPNQMHLSKLVKELLDPKKQMDSDQPSGGPENQGGE